MAMCDECGYLVEAGTGVEANNAGNIADLTSALRTVAPSFATALAAADPSTLRVRPAPAVWSALEYTAHTRDALEWYGDRIQRILTEDRPQLRAFDWDAACEERRYNQEDPDEALAGLERAVSTLAETLARLSATALTRTGVGIDGGDRTVLALVRRAVHEGVHHLLDVERVLQTVTPARP